MLWQAARAGHRSASAPRTYPPTATMSVSYTGFVDSTVPLKLLLPNATIANGEVSCDLTSFAGGAGLFTTLHATGAVTMDTSATVGTTLAVAGVSTLHATNAIGAITATTTITAGTGLVATTGGVTASAGNIVATLGNITASAGNVTAPLGGVSAATVTATTSLVTTGATVVGLEVPFNLSVANLNGTSVYRFTPSVSGTIVKIISNLQAALATGDATITAAIGGVAVTNGVVTITQAASAAGDVDLATPTAANVVVADVSDVSFTVGGTNSANVAAQLTVVVRRSA